MNKRRQLGLAILTLAFLGFDVYVFLRRDELLLGDNNSSSKGSLTFQINGPESDIENSFMTSHISNVEGVIILTNVRSGSSFLGQIFNQNPDAVYFFEPIRFIWESYEQTSILTYINGTTRRLYGNHSKSEKESVSRKVIKNLLTCQMDDIPNKMTFVKKRISFGLLLPKNQKALKDYDSCMSGLTHLNKTSCLSVVRPVCLKSSFKVMKLVRLSMEAIEPILTQLPKVKVIYLVRDPRASLLSKKKTGLFKCDLECEARHRCKDLLFPDIVHALYLRTKYRGRVMRVRYEDIAADPLYWSREIYRFLGKEIPAVVTEYVQNATSSSVDNGSYGTKRRNSSATANRWETTIPLEMARTIDSYCKDVLDTLGYKPYGEILRKHIMAKGQQLNAKL